MLRALCGFVVLSSLGLILGCNGGGGGGGGGGGVGGPQPPVLTSGAGASKTVAPGALVEFDVEATDPDGDPLTLVLLNPPPGCLFKAARNEPSPVVRSVRWPVSTSSGGLILLRFLARDNAVPPNTTALEVPVRVQGPSFEALILTGDVTGDGEPDVIAAAPRADVAGVEDAGALYVWSGSTHPAGDPAARLVVPGASTDDLEGDRSSTVLTQQGIQIADVTGDGILDVVVGASRADLGGTVDHGAVFVWAGGAGLQGEKAPDATLTTPFQSLLGNVGSGQGIQIADVSGDSVLDLVVGAKFACIDGCLDSTGTIFVWNGGASLTGDVAPDATLAVPGALGGDFLGDVGTSLVGNDAQGIQLADVTGDALLDVVAGAANAGAIYVWAGGAALAGTPALHATLTVAGGVDCTSGSGQGILLADVTEDAILDVVAASRADAIYVWAGGASLPGNPVPLAVLSVPGVGLGDIERSGQGIQLADVTGDSVLEVIAGAYLADIDGVDDCGAVYVWTTGATLAGSPAPQAVLSVPGAQLGDMLGLAQPQGIQLGDVTGDAVLDVIALTILADIGGVADTGAAYLWAGGPGMAGIPALQATLSVPGAQDGDRVGMCLLADVTGDEVLDLVITPRDPADAGAVYVWAGGATLTGAAPLRATLLSPLDGLGVQVADLTGDDVLDVVAGSVFASVGGLNQNGALHVWSGGAGLTGTPAPIATLAGPSDFDRMGGSPGVRVLVAEVSGDEQLDLIVGAVLADVGAFDTGAVFVWSGGAGLTGTPAPRATLSGQPVVGDRLGQAGRGGIQLADLDGDLILDVLAGAGRADIAGKENVGAVYAWSGGAALAGEPAALSTFTVNDAQEGDFLGDLGY